MRPKSTFLRHRFIPFVGLTLIALLTLAGCSSDARRRLWLKAPGWSRAQQVGEMSIADPAPLVLDERGHIYILTMNEEAGHDFPHIQALNRQADVLWEASLAGAVVRPDKPSILYDGQTLLLYWLSQRVLYHARIGVNGELLSSPQAISGEAAVESYSAVVDGEGNPHIWIAGTRQEPGLYVLEDGGAKLTLVDAEGITPQIRFDDGGMLHAVWAQRPPGFGDTRFFYAGYEDGIFDPEEQTVISEPKIATTSFLIGPVLGLDQENVTVIWSIEIRTGTDAGQANTFYLTFPKGEPGLRSPELRLRIPIEHDLPYEEYQVNDRFLAGPRVLLDPGPSPQTGSLKGITTNPLPGPEMTVGLQAQFSHLWSKQATQTALVYFQGGLPTSYQMLSFTRTSSSRLVVRSDPDGYLYVTWLEPGDPSFRLYLASTAPDIRESLGAITADDVGQISGEVIFGMLVGAVLAPLAGGVWILLPLLTIGLTSFLRRRSQGLKSPGTVISISLGVLVFVAAQYATIPGVKEYVPFSAWFPRIPGWMQGPLQILVPLSITVGSLWAAWHYTYRRQNQSPLFFMLVFAGLDSALILAVYGILIYGAF